MRVALSAAARVSWAPPSLRRRRAAASVMASAEAGRVDVAPAVHEPGETHRVRGLVLRDHRFQVPLDHRAGRGGETLSVFLREVVAHDKTDDASLPWLLFLQGGPGFESPRPVEAGGWIKEACTRFRVGLLDQRGTGASSRVSTAAVLRRGGPKEQADYLSLFRADSIVMDCEAIRKALGVDKWSLLGQSFGGFCAITYLSFYGAALREVLLTGGLAPHAAAAPGCSADAVYAALLPRVARQTAKFYKRFPGDRARVRDIVQQLAQRAAQGRPVRLPASGAALTPRAFQMVGWNFSQAGGFEGLHYVLETAWHDGEGELSAAFLRGVEGIIPPWDTNPLYALLHEPIYCNGGGAAAAWSAERVLFQTASDVMDPARAADLGRDVPLTGEMIFPFLFDTVPGLAPLAAAAEELARRRDWPPLYDEYALHANKVPTAAAAYYEDMYVDFALGEETAAGIGGARLWVTSEFLHSGVREDGPRLLKGLLAMTRGEEPVR